MRASTKSARCWESLEAHGPKGLDEPSRPHSAARVAGNEALLIDERAATRGRSATEGGDENAGVKRRYPFDRASSRSSRELASVPRRNARGERRTRDAHA